MLEHLRAPFKRLIEPFAKALVSLGLTANAVTVIGAIGTIVVAFATGITGWLFAGAVVLTLLVLADSLDGSIAALTTGGTQFGAFLDSTLDRIADWALLAGVVIFFILHADWWYDINRSSPDCISWIGIAAAMVSMMTSFVTSYARARAESVGFEVKNGIATRADRLVIILVGMAITGLTRQGIVARHRHDTVGRIGISHRIPTHLRSQAPNGHRGENISAVVTAGGRPHPKVRKAKCHRFVFGILSANRFRIISFETSATCLGALCQVIPSGRPPSTRRPPSTQSAASCSPS